MHAVIELLDVMGTRQVAAGQCEMRNGMETSPLTRSERLEYEETLRLLACLIFEIQVNWTEKVDEEPPGNIFSRFEAIIEHAPPAVLPLIEHLRRYPPQEREGELYTYAFPFIEWRCAQHLPTWEIAPRTLRELEGSSPT